MTEVRARSWEVTTSLPGAGRSIKAAALWAALIVTASLLASAGAGHLSPLSKTDPALAGMAESRPHSTLSVIVRETNPASLDAERRVWALGGHVTHELPIIGSFAARIPGRALDSLADSIAVSRVWGDGRVRMSSDMGQFDSWAPNTVWQKSIRLPQAQTYYNGAGVTVALLDTGVSHVADLGNRVLARVDFTRDQDGYDRFGHGTHMAGIIAGDGSLSGGGWTGVAPRANLVSVKVAGADGSTDVSVVIAGLQWVVTHRSDYQIRVLNLSFGTDSKQSYLIDPLDFAVEQVWRSGIFVVVAAGNRGPDAGTINKPGDDPFVLTVGAADLKNTIEKSDDAVTSFSSRGPTQDGFAKPGLLAPGVTIVSNRAVGSTIDQLHPSARVGDYYFKGTGTSQATAVVSGVAALMFQANPSVTPDVAKATLFGTAFKNMGQPLVDAYGAASAAALGQYVMAPANVGLTASTGLGSLEASRGSYHVSADLDGDGHPELVKGEIDVLGNSWSAAVFTAGNSWSGNSWTGNEWSSCVFEGNSWSGNEWSGNEWSGNEWSGNTWSGDSWS
ncbi:MAG TPA: S8 family peptidase [Actinomycetota bacterium]|jgi:serine protease AprX